MALPFAGWQWQWQWQITRARTRSPAHPAGDEPKEEDSGMNDEAAVDESRSASFWRGSLADAESLAQGDFAFEVIASMTKRDP